MLFVTSTSWNSEVDRNKGAFVSLLKAMDAGDFQALAEAYHPDYVDHATGGTRGEGSDLSRLREVFVGLREAFPDVKHEVHALLGDGDLLAARVSATGTHTGPLAGLGATGRAITLTSTAIYRFVDGRIVERWCDHSPSVMAALTADAPDLGAGGGG